jgi:hypothetical protein
VSPDLRLYRRTAGPVVPFLLVDGTLSYESGPNDTWGVGGGGSVGLGVEWLPLEGMSISGSTGVGAIYGHDVRDGVSHDGFDLGTVRSQLELTLYF